LFIIHSIFLFVCFNNHLSRITVFQAPEKMLDLPSKQQAYPQRLWHTWIFALGPAPGNSHFHMLPSNPTWMAYEVKEFPGQGTCGESIECSPSMRNLVFI
jgi:hypothetical protein